ncbi:MAG: hypothetical protein FD123_1638 [Bacteroidetes bacterium]|nr:MAG: hypothetical protein FD123_1638 [Bacteroidota bacterium]
MEKQFNDIIDGQQLDGLLREAFLFGNGSPEQTQNLHDMHASIVFAGEPAALFTPAKEKAFLKRIGAAGSGRWLNGLWLIPVLAAGIFLAWWLNQTGTNEHTSGAAVAGQSTEQQNVPAAENGVPAKEEVYTDGSGGLITAGAPDGGTTAALIDSLTEDSLKERKISPVSNYSSRTGYQPPRLLPEEYSGPYDTIPVLTESDKKKYARQKKIMIDQVINGSSAQNRRAKNESYVYVPMGSFHFGDTIVSVQAFYMQQTEVTNLQYRTFLYDLVMQGRAEDYLKARVRNENWNTAVQKKTGYEKDYCINGAYDRFPAVNVTREGAEMYCKWLTQEVNKVRAKNGDPMINDLRIPTEPEWEYAAKSNRDTAIFPWHFNRAKNQHGCYMCNIMLRPGDYTFGGKCGKTGRLDSPKTVAAMALNREETIFDVYSFNPNDWGIYCSIGNAAEMVWTWSFKKDVKDRTAKAKGGSWRNHEDEVKIHADKKFEYENITEASPYISFRPVYTYLR